MSTISTPHRDQELVEQLREDLEAFLQVPEHQQALTPQAAENFRALIDIHRTGREAVVFAEGRMLTTGEAARLLGVSRMTVVRLIERGALQAEPGQGAHRRISALELERYREASAHRRREALKNLAQDVTAVTTDDHIITTR